MREFRLMDTPDRKLEVVSESCSHPDQQEIERLRESNNLLKTQCLLSQSEFIALDMDFKIVSFTDGATRLFKLLPKDRGRQISKIVHVIKNFDIETLINASIQKQKTVVEQVNNFSGHHFSISSTPYLSHDNCIGGCIVCIDDLEATHIGQSKSIFIQQPDTNWKSTAFTSSLPVAPQANSLSSYRDLFIYAPVGFLVLRRDGSIKQANQTVASMLNTSVEHLVGQSFIVFVDPGYRENILKNIWRGWHDQANECCEIKLKHNNKSFDAICNILAAKNSDNHLELRVNLTDISAIKYREKREKTFFSIAGHELRTPLTNIKLALDMALQKSEDVSVDSMRSFIKVAHRAALRLQNLADSMLDYNSAVSGDLKLVKKQLELASLIEDIVMYQGLDHSQEIDFQFIHPEHEIWVYSDPDRLYQVIVNLLQNAIRHSPDKGTVKIHMEQAGKWIRVNVIDHGAGVDDSIKNDLFEPFVQAEHALEDDKNKNSHGLGLSISRSIIELLGGKIGYQRTDENETCFYFDIPVSHKEY